MNTKKFFAVLIFLLMTACLLSGCSSSKVTSSSVDGNVGNYHMFETSDINEYLNFLENFDDSAYDIVDISITNNSSGRPYRITYKNQIEAE